jgi:hypothetical protein
MFRFEEPKLRFEVPMFRFEEPMFRFEVPMFGFEEPMFRLEESKFRLEESKFRLEAPKFRLEAPRFLPAENEFVLPKSNSPPAATNASQWEQTATRASPPQRQLAAESGGGAFRGGAGARTQINPLRTAGANARAKKFRNLGAKILHYPVTATRCLSRKQESKQQTREEQEQRYENKISTAGDGRRHLRRGPPGFRPKYHAGGDVRLSERRFHCPVWDQTIAGRSVVMFSMPTALTMGLSGGRAGSLRLS